MKFKVLKNARLRRRNALRMIWHRLAIHRDPQTIMAGVFRRAELVQHVNDVFPLDVVRGRMVEYHAQCPFVGGHPPI